MMTKRFIPIYPSKPHPGSRPSQPMPNILKRPFCRHRYQPTGRQVWSWLSLEDHWRCTTCGHVVLRERGRDPNIENLVGLAELKDSLSESKKWIDTKRFDGSKQEFFASAGPAGKQKKMERSMEKLKGDRPDGMRRLGARMIIGVAFLLGAAHVADVSRAGQHAAEIAREAARKSSETVILNLEDIVRADTRNGISYRLGDTGLSCGHGGSIMIDPGKILDGRDAGKIRHLCSQVNGWLRLINAPYPQKHHANMPGWRSIDPYGMSSGRHDQLMPAPRQGPPEAKNFQKENARRPANISIAGAEAGDGTQRLVVTINDVPACDITNRRQIQPAANSNLQVALDHRKVCQALHRQVHGGQRLPNR